MPVSRTPIRSALTALLAAGAALAFAAPANAAPQVDAAPTFSASALDGVKASFDKNFKTAGVPDSVAGWYVDQATNRVVIEIVGNDAAGIAFAQKHASAEVQIVTGAAQPTQMWNIIGGQAITRSGSRCSAGFNARNSAGTRYVLTAGHCTELGGTWSGTGGTIGPVSGTSFPTNDYGRITVSSSAAASTPLVDRYTSGSDVTVTGAGNAGVNTNVCRSGSTTGWRCGRVTATNQTVNYGGGDIVSGLTRTTACAQPGDSGGPYVSNPGTGTRVTAYGLLSGGSGNCTTGGTTFYQPINEVLSAYGLSLYTG